MAYGSRSAEESAERMRRAGFEEWEIAAELEQRERAERELAETTARIRESATGPLEARADASGFREEEARLSLKPAPRMDFAAEAERLAHAIDEAYDFGDVRTAKATEERLAALLALEADLGARGRQAPAPEGARSAEKAAEAQPRPRGVSVSVPKEVSGRDAVRMWTNPRNGKEMAEITLPPHASVGGKDASFHRFSVESRFLKAFDNDPGYYHVLFPKTSRDGSPWTVTLQKKEGHWERPGAPKGERGAWIVDAASSLKVSSASLAEAMDGFREERRAWAAAQPREDAPALDVRRAEDEPAAPAPDAAKQGAGGIGDAARNARAASGKQGRERWVEAAAPARRQDDGAPTPAEDARAFRAQAASLASVPPRAERAIR